MATEKGLCRIVMPNETLQDWSAWAARISPEAELQEDAAALERTGIVDWLKAYFNGERMALSPDIPLDLVGTAFQKQVWQELGRVPYGEARTYGDIAVAIGRPSAV
ncbi:cysteine methyltransferase, partial [Escherichia coli]|nr:cysteine methyltransferase [Escherichia coli]